MAESQEQLAALQAEGKTVMAVAMDSQAVGLIAVVDHIRATSRETIAELRDSRKLNCPRDHPSNSEIHRQG
jgi:cation transport ATPase